MPISLSRINQQIRYLKDFVLRNGHDMDGNERDAKETERRIYNLMLKKRLLKK